MKRIARGPAGAVLTMLLAGCPGHAARSSGDLGSPATSVGDEMRPLAGRWQGALTETGGFYYSGYAPLDLVIDPRWDVDGHDRESPSPGNGTNEAGPPPADRVRARRRWP
jgi:hypothetical protein